MAVHIDVSDHVAVEKMMNEVAEKLGRIDVLLNNAGVHVAGSVLETSIDDWRRIAGVDIDGVVFCSKFALPHLLKTKGCIVNTASVSGLGGDWGRGLLLRGERRGGQPDARHGARSRR
ncbi:3-oxoacyl-[acyl-carrier-protein] reductase FabG [Serratia marcescens]|uniref:3-oxoacyl-[acyl-carrier-protein] reductase FabG n=1 Tax=Serratia marcescens TaxID=615 RepID=A0A379ZUX2_SERMA|nr:3-oxoacyl-[acyl-carrier-protein] reductase FabG [Serratia marcescens]